MSDPLKFTHGGIEVVYDESADVWRFTLRNRDRSCSSPARCKQIIDKPPPKPKNTFQRVTCWFKGYDGWKRVEATSVAESFGRAYVWIVTEEKSRSKEPHENLYPSGPRNDPILSKCIQISAQIKALREEHDRLVKSMTCLEVPDEEDKE